MFHKRLLYRLLALLVACASAAAAQPNIIFVLTDDLGWGDLGVFYQNSRDFEANRNTPSFATPHLDTLAAGGIRLNRHYSGAPVCAPARASLLTGVHQGHATIRNNQFDKELDDNHTLGTVLREAGYATANIGKWGLQGGAGFPGHPRNRGFDYFFGYIAHLDAHFHYPKEQGRDFYENFTNIREQLDKCYSTDVLTARAKRWITDQQTADPGKPFFLYLSYPAPHAQLNVPTQPYPEGGGLSGGLQWLGSDNELINTASGTIDSWIHPDYASATYDHDNDPATAERAWPDYAKRHATMVRRLDNAIGDLRQLLSDLNIDEDTLIVFTSDNGPHNETGASGAYQQDPRFFKSYADMDGIKRDLWEGGIRVPAIARWPGGIPAGRSSDAASQFHDWMPTLAELAGVPAPERSDGVSLLPTLTGSGAQRPGLVYSEYEVGGSTPNYSDFEPSHRGASRWQMQLVHLEGYKAVRYNTTSSDTPFRVYDVVVDPKEIIDLSGQPDVPTQDEIEAHIARSRRAGGNVSRPYDAVLVPPTLSIAAASSSSTSILRTDFSGRQLSGTTADNFSWTSDFGEEANVTTSLAFTGSASGFIAGYGLESGARNPPGEPIPVAGNIENAGPWGTSFEFTPEAGHELGAVEVQCYAISANGVHQLNPKSISWEVTIQGGGLDESATVSGSDPGGNGALTLAAGFPGITLEEGTSYAISLTAASPNPSGGNNLALNSIALTAPENSGENSGPIPDGMTQGLKYQSYEGEFSWVPDFVGMVPVSSGKSSGLDLSLRSRDDDIGIAFSGFLKVPSDGNYSFFLSTDTAAFVRLHDAHLVDADFGYTGGTELSSGPIPLAAGLHPIRIHYRHASGADHKLDLQWQGPGISKQAVPEANLLVELEPPSAVVDETAAFSGESTGIAVLENDRPGIGPEALQISELTQPAYGSVSAGSGATNVIYTPKADYIGADSFTYTADNGFGIDSATVSLEVLPNTSTIYLPFDETSGATASDALGRPLGTLQGFAVPDWVDGKWGGALRFFGDGDADSVVLTGNQGIIGTAARTVSFWLDADSAQGNEPPTLVSWGADNGTTPGNRFDINLDSTSGYLLRSEFNASGVNFETTERSDLRGAGWVHCAIVVPENARVDQVLAYLDGKPATATPLPADSTGTVINTSAGNDITIGNWATDSGRPFRGSIDDLRIHPRALSPGEVAELAARTPQETAAAEWFFRYTGNDLPDDTDWASDADSDGLSAFLEYALGGNPSLFSDTVKPHLSEKMNFIFNRRRSGLPPSAYTAEFSTTLGNDSWSLVEPVEATPHPDLPGFDKVVIPLPSDQAERGFFRLRVTKP